MTVLDLKFCIVHNKKNQLFPGLILHICEIASIWHKIHLDLLNKNKPNSKSIFGILLQLISNQLKMKIFSEISI